MPFERRSRPTASGRAACDSTADTVDAAADAAASADDTRFRISATVALAAAAGLRGIAIEAGATIVLDREEVAHTADRAGLFVIGIRRR